MNNTSNGSYEGPRGRVGRTKVAILTIIDEEFEAVQTLFDLQHYVSGPGTAYFVANPSPTDEFDVVLLRSGDRTNIPAAKAVQDVMEDFRPQLIVLVGVAGGLCDDKNKGRDGIHVGDVLIADFVSYVEFLKLDGGHLRMRNFAIDHPSVPIRESLAFPLSKTFKIKDHLVVQPPADPPNAPLKIHIGNIVSAEKVLGDVDSPVQKDLLQPFDKALAIDMESIGVAKAVCSGRTSSWYHPRYVIVRGISDLVSAEENNAVRTKWKAFAAHTAALVAKGLITKFLSLSS
ncbi:nucleoside phosphorylase [Paraburkholderia sp. BL18I3N2]|uniref:5'-methylthioadenosine/S-adenosylhomocysteine nucleosidase family protein n=1 Tax=Paraburkholderia sp. BL18I3N2 TaxID=1938799 RepID=UPI000D47D7C7|nr:hypothetical protein [Paraburkholderia sp. BL18I3N2]PRX34223.1 nucleoside phosphorylase [Paraburkholderia sp. BL18I3N2]